MTRRLLRILLCMLILTACGGKKENRQDAPVPRREAYPRLSLPEALYRVDSVGGIPLEVNEKALSTVENERWLTLSYPNQSAVIYITLTTIENNDRDPVTNRLERLSMNTGGAPTTVNEFVNNHGYNCLLMFTPAGSPTPVQFIAVIPGDLMLSGSAMVDGLPTAPADSLKPVVEMLKRDITHMLDEL